MAVSWGIRRQTRRASRDPLLAYEPTILYDPADGYYADGAIQFGVSPGRGPAPSRLFSADNFFDTGAGVNWFFTLLLQVIGENGSGAPNQTLVSKAATGNYEFAVWRDQSTRQVVFRVFSADGSSHDTLTSSATVADDEVAHVVFGIASGQMFLYVNGVAQTPVAVTVTLVAGTADLWFGEAASGAGGVFVGRLDAVGFAKGVVPSAADVAHLYNGGQFRNYHDLDAARKAIFDDDGSWWDFGNGVTYDDRNLDLSDTTNEDAGPYWFADWLMDATGNARHLEQNSTGAVKPHTCRPLCGSLHTENCARGARFGPDASGNDNFWRNMFWQSLPGWEDDVFGDGSPGWYMDGLRFNHRELNGYYGQYMNCYELAMTGVNRPWSAAAVIKPINPFFPSAQAGVQPGNPHPGLGYYATGWYAVSSPGYRPDDKWRVQDPNAVNSQQGDGLNLMAENGTYVVPPAYQINSYHKDESGLNKNLSGGGILDTRECVMLTTFDGTAKKKWRKLPGQPIELLYSVDHSVDNQGTDDPLGNKNCYAVTVGDRSQERDFYYLNKTEVAGLPAFDSGGARAHYGHIGKFLFKDGEAYSDQEIEEIGDIMSAGLAQESFPIQWIPGVVFRFDATGLFQDSSGVTPAAADNDPVGRWNDASIYADKSTSYVKTSHNGSQSTDANRPTLKVSGSSKWVRFANNSANRLIIAHNAQLSPGTTSFTTFIIARSATGQSVDFRGLLVKGPYAGSAGLYFAVNETTDNWVYFNGTADLVLGSNDGTWTLLSMERTGTGAGACNLYKNGTLTGTGTESRNLNNTNDLNVGRVSDQNRSLGGDVALIIHCKQLFSAAVLAQIHARLNEIRLALPA
jgi:hypothetical protein